MKKLVIMFFTALAIGIFGGHFLYDKAWLDALIATGKSVVFYGFWAPEEVRVGSFVFGDSLAKNLGEQFNSFLFWGFVIISFIIWSFYESHRRKLSVHIFCAKCDQYLGTAAGFDCPCPKCGSNRYRRE